MTDRRSILAARLVIVLFRAFEQAARHADLTIPQFRFMLMLRRGPRRASELAASSGIGRPTASALIAEMERRGLIYRRRDEADARAVELRLTEDGERRFARLDEALAGAFETHLPDAEREAILDGFAAMALFIDERGKRRPPAEPTD